MKAFAQPTVAFHGSTDPDAPLVVLLHGRGSHEREIISLAPHLPEGAAYAAVRAPIAEGGGFAWFANRGIGRPVAASLSETMAWFREWLDGIAPAGRPVFVVGFSGGAAFAGGLVLSDPARYAGVAVLYGTLPFDAGVPVTASRLAHTPVFVAQGDADQVIARELLDRTWTYLLTESGATVEAHRDPGGHGITAGTLHRLAGWLHARLNFLAHNPTVTVLEQEPRRLAAPGPTPAAGVLPYTRYNFVKVKPGKGPQYRRTWEKYNKPVFDKLVADRTVLAFGLAAEDVKTDGDWTHFVWIATADMAGGDKVGAAFAADRARRSEKERNEITEEFLEATEPDKARSMITRSRIFKVAPMK